MSKQYKFRHEGIWNKLAKRFSMEKLQELHANQESKCIYINNHNYYPMYLADLSKDEDNKLKNELLDKYKFIAIFKQKAYTSTFRYIMIHGIEDCLKEYTKQQNKYWKYNLFNKIFHPKQYILKNFNFYLNYKLRDNCWLFWKYRTIGSKYHNQFISKELFMNWLKYILTGEIAEGNGVYIQV